MAKRPSDGRQMFGLPVKSMHGGNDTVLVRVERDAVYVMGHCMGSYMNRVEIGNHGFALKLLIEAVAEALEKRDGKDKT